MTSGAPKAAMRGIVLEDLRAAEGATSLSIMAPQLFDRNAESIELTRPGDPFAWPAEPTVETVRLTEAVDVSGGYLRLSIATAPTSSAEPEPPQAANDDSEHHELDSASTQG